MAEITQILEAVERGEAKAEELLPLVYEELRRVAAARLAQERPGQTLQATALVHEAWLRVTSPGQPEWQGRRHFFGAAAEAMRRILVENARRKRRVRHGGELQRVDIAEVEVASPMPDDKLLALDDALDKLAECKSTGGGTGEALFLHWADPGASGGANRGVGRHRRADLDLRPGLAVPRNQKGPQPTGMNRCCAGHRRCKLVGRGSRRAHFFIRPGDW